MHAPAKAPSTTPTICIVYVLVRALPVQVAYPFQDLNLDLIHLLLNPPQFQNEDDAYSRSLKVEPRTKDSKK